MPLLHFFAILSLPLLWLLFISASLTAIPAFILKWVIGYIGSKVNPKLVTLVSGGDVLFGEDVFSQSAKPHSTLVGYTAVEGGMTLSDLQHKYLKQVILSTNPLTGQLNYPKFQQYVQTWGGYSFWRWEDDFRIEKHIRLFQPPTLGVPLSESDLLTFLGSLANKPFPKGQSPWEYLYVPAYLPRDSTVPIGLVIMRIHHSLGDGYSITKCFVSYACGRGNNHNLLLNPTAPTNKRTSAHDPAPKLLKLLKKLIQATSRQVELVCRLATMPLCLLQHMVTLDSSPWFIPRSKMTQNWHFGLTRKIPVATVKMLSQQKKVCFSAVLFSAVGGGIRRFCVKEGWAQEQIPKEIQCFAPFPKAGHPDNALVNYFTTAVIRLFPGEASSEERLQLNERDMAEVKRSTFPLAMIWILTLLSAFPTFYVRLVGSNWFASAILSNFPGPREVLHYFQQYRAPDIVFWAPHLNGTAGIGIGMLTYGDSLKFTLNIDSAIISSQAKVQELCDCIEQEIYSLLPQATKPEEGNKIGKSESASIQNAQLRLRSVS